MSAFGLASAPDLMNVVVGFRGFHWDPGSPHILLGGAAWEAGENVAVCKTGLPHKAPDNDCGCGLYAYHDLSRMDTNGSYGPISAAVAAWGKLCVHGDGFRAEKAQVIAIAHQKEFDSILQQIKATDFLQSTTNVKATQKELIRQGIPDEDAMKEIAEAYAIPYLAWDELEPYALEHGEPLPAEMIPGRSRAKMAIKSPAAPKGKTIPVPPQPPAVIGSGATLPSTSQQQATSRVARPLPSTQPITHHPPALTFRDDKPYAQYSPSGRYTDALLLSLPVQLGGVIVSLYEVSRHYTVVWAVLLLLLTVSSLATIFTERTKL